MTVSEVTALFTLPLANTLASNFWSVINESGLVFIPFVIVLWKETLSARAMGRDEGSPSILSIKGVETNFIKMFVVILLAMMPWGNTAPSYKYNQYQSQGIPLMFIGANNVSDVTPTSAYVSLASGAPPILFGLLHDFATGASGALIAKMPCHTTSSDPTLCDANISAISLGMSQGAKVSERAGTVHSISEFSKQCHAPATTQVISELQSTLNLVFTDLTASELRFNSAQMDMIYEGAHHISGTAPTHTIQTTSDWVHVATRNATIKCSDAANIIYNTLKSNEQTWLTPAIEQRKSLANSYSATVITDVAIESELINHIYSNTIAMVLNSAQKHERWWVEEWNEAKATAMNAGLIYSTTAMMIDQYVKSLLIYTIAPILVTVLQASIIFMGPVVLLLTAYSPLALYHLALFYTSITLVPYVLSVAEKISSAFIAIGSHSPFGTGMQNTSLWGTDATFLQGMSVMNAGLMLPTILVMAWLVLFQLLGVFAVGMISNLVTSVGENKASKLAQALSMKIAAGMQQGFNNAQKDFKNKE